MEFLQYNPRATGNAFGKVRANQLAFREAIEELQKEVKELKAQIKALKETKKVKEVK